MIHLLFNIIGSVFFLVVLYAGNALFRFPFWENTMDMGSYRQPPPGVQHAPVLPCFFPSTASSSSWSRRWCPATRRSGSCPCWTTVSCSSPSLALERAHDAVVQMSEFARDNYRLAVELIWTIMTPRSWSGSTKPRWRWTSWRVLLDNYLVKLTDRALTAEESTRVSELLHTLSDFERIGDYAVNVSESAVVLHDRNITFSPAGPGRAREASPRRWERRWTRR